MLVDAELERLAGSRFSAPCGLDRACADALLSPGKRVRPILLLLTAELFRVPAARGLGLGVIVETVHAASLVLDDLPSMDDAETRRGRAAIHRVYGEAVAILAAFRLLSVAHAALPAALEQAGVPRARRTGEITALADVVGRLCRGQELDLEAAAVTVEDLEAIHAAKTGALFELAVRWGALTGRPSAGEEAAVLAFARNLGLAFQVVDDVLDVTGDPETMGKPTGKDARRVTFTDLLGVEGARRLARELVQAAVESLEPFGKAALPLKALAARMVDRVA